MTIFMVAIAFTRLHASKTKLCNKVLMITKTWWNFSENEQ